ncbi:MAG: branched-chain amino acid ABC transporter permease [Sulfolobales archaeon]
MRLSKIRAVTLRLSLDLYVCIGVVIFLSLSPLIYPDYFFINALYITMVYMLSALAWNIMGGYTGLISFGHAAFFGVGAYTLALAYNAGVSPWLGFLLSGLISLFYASVVGLPLLRLRGHWFALATIAIGEATKLVFNNWEFVGGNRGIELIRKTYSIEWLYFREAIYYNLAALLILTISLVAIYAFLKSRIGYYLQAIRESEETSMIIGLNPHKYRYIAMLVSAFFTGIAGALYTIRYRFIDPFAVMDLFVSVQIALIAIVGGVYSFSGPLIGSIIVVPIAEYARYLIGGTFGARFFGIHLFIYGIILLILALFYPGGIYSIIKKSLRE